MASTKCVNLDNLNPCIKVMEYAVRGPLVIRATEIEKELEQVGGNKDAPKVKVGGKPKDECTETKPSVSAMTGAYRL